MFQFSALVGLYGSSHWDVVALMAVSNSYFAVTFFRFDGGLSINATARFSIIECIFSGNEFVTSTSLVAGTTNVGVTGTLAMIATHGTARHSLHRTTAPLLHVTLQRT